MTFIRFFVATCSVIGNLILFLIGLAGVGLGGMCAFAFMSSSGQVMIGALMVLFGLFLSGMAGKNIWKRIKGVIDLTSAETQDSPFDDN